MHLDLFHTDSHRVPSVVLDLGSIDPTALRQLRGADVETARSILRTLLAQLPAQPEKRQAA